MAQILVTDITNKTATVAGTGTFDLLMESVNLHLLDEWNEGRLTGAEYATVYSGALQATLAQSIQFQLSKQASDKQAELLISQINESSEKTDLIIAQTAQAYEGIKASQDKTTRDNVLNNNQVAKLVEEINILKAKALEEVAATTRNDTETDLKVIMNNYDAAIKAQQELGLKEKNGLVLTTYTYYTNGVDSAGGTSTTTVLANVLGPVLSTTIASGNGVSTTALDHVILADKDVLIQAQTLGFKSDTKQKLLKQMMDGFGTDLAINGTGVNIPEAAQDAAIDQLSQEILLENDSAVRIQLTVEDNKLQLPDVGA